MEKETRFLSSICKNQFAYKRNHSPSRSRGISTFRKCIPISPFEAGIGPCGLEMFDIVFAQFLGLRMSKDWAAETARVKRWIND